MNVIGISAFIAYVLANVPQSDVEQLKKPPLILAKNYQKTNDLKTFYASEKLDGIRAYWNGKALISRQGNIINAPDWFIEGFPEEALDGELWLGRNQFEKTVATVNDKEPDEAEWKKIKYFVFDLPAASSRFEKRFLKLKKMVEESENPYLEIVEQYPISSRLDLNRMLNDIVSHGGEGLMLHRKSAYYFAGRTDDLQKLKPYEDDEAIVIGYLPGKGKYKNMTGAILVKNSAGKKFKIGSGFSDIERQNPPKIGSVITYRHRGYSNKGTPKFATYLRVKSDIDI